MSYKQALKQQEELRRREAHAPEVDGRNGVSPRQVPGSRQQTKSGRKLPRDESPSQSQARTEGHSRAEVRPFWWSRFR